VTDPPYGVELDMEWRDRAGYNGMGPAERSYMKQQDTLKKRGGAGVSGDTITDWSAAFVLVPSLEVAYVWHATTGMIEVAQGLQGIGFEIRQQIIWMKTQAAMSRSAYNWQHEPCWYAVRKGKTAEWIGPHMQSTVWEYASPKQIMGGSKEAKFDHPTQKPIGCMSTPISNHSGDVYEPFVGSGTTIIAAEQLGRRCYAMEIDPRYVAVAIERWEQFTGRTAERVDG
jgi:DNA modification methylase